MFFCRKLPKIVLTFSVITLFIFGLSGCIHGIVDTFTPAQAETSRTTIFDANATGNTQVYNPTEPADNNTNGNSPEETTPSNTEITITPAEPTPLASATPSPSPPTEGYDNDNNTATPTPSKEETPEPSIEQLPSESPAEPHTPSPREPRNLVAFTFDDGPHRYTEIIIDLLHEHGGVATFCVLGYRVEGFTDTLLRTIELGNEVIGHSWRHANMTLLDAEEIAYQILAPHMAIYEASGIEPPPLFRAPYGLIDDYVVEVMYELGFSMLRWSMDPRDWAIRNPEHIYNYIMENVVPGSMILLHDIHASTMEAMHYVIPALVEKGFELVTASELIAYLYGDIEPGKEYRGRR